MYKEVGLVLAGAICFDLGVVIVPAQATNEKSAEFLKIDNLSSNQEYLKIKMDDVSVSAKACATNKGTLVDFKGTKYCQTPKQPGGASSNQKK